MKKIFLRSFFISLVVVFCIGVGFFGVAKAYENIRLVAFGEYRKAIEIKENKIMIFDYEIKI